MRNYVYWPKMDNDISDMIEKCKGCALAAKIRNESLRGLVVAMLGQCVTASRYVDWMLHCWSVVVGGSIFPVLTVRWVNRGCVDLVASL